MNTNLNPTQTQLSSSFITSNFQSHFFSHNFKTPLNSFSFSSHSSIISCNFTIIKSNLFTQHFFGVQSSVFGTKFDHHLHQTVMATPSFSTSSGPLKSLSWDNQSFISADQFKPFQLDDMSDFVLVESRNGYISICGFGSLLSERSARSTFPKLTNFRVARLKGFRRVFAHVAPIFFERGIAKPETMEISSLSVEPCEGEELIVTVFEITKSEVPYFVERELEFRFLAVLPETLNGRPFSNPAVLCTAYSDEEFFNVRCKGSKEVYHQHYGRFGIDKIWRDDVLPCRTYLRHCVLAAKNLGDATYNNFLDHTYLADRQTTIRQYLATTGAGIMEEEPPESLKTRYGG